MTSLSSSGLGLRKVPAVTDKEFKDLRALIYKTTGIDIPERRKYLVENRLGPRLKELKLKNFTEYYQYLTASSSKNNELTKLYEKITTNETSFFRDTKQLEAFRKNVLEDIIQRQKKAGTKEINIWSAGCSSGEEAYTLGIMLHEMLRASIIGWKITITANDISEDMIKKAREGVYNEHSLRSTPQEMLDRYFSKEPAGYRIHPKVQDLINFDVLNLNDPQAVKMRVPKSHVIFCRNVVIYFDDEMRKRVLNLFYDNLYDGGYLVLGHTESIHKYTRAFKPCQNTGNIIYQKQDKVSC